MHSFLAKQRLIKLNCGTLCLPLRRQFPERLLHLSDIAANHSHLSLKHLSFMDRFQQRLLLLIDLRLTDEFMVGDAPIPI